MPLTDPLFIDYKVVNEAAHRCDRLLLNFKGGHTAALQFWSRESRFWALRPRLFEKASGTPYAEVVQHQKDNGAPFFDPHDWPAARAKAVEALSEAERRKHDVSHAILDRWNYWVHFPSILRQVLELDPDELQARIDDFDQALMPAVEKRQAELVSQKAEYERQEAERKMERAARRATKDARVSQGKDLTRHENALMPAARPRKMRKPSIDVGDFPAPYRMRADIVDRDIAGGHIGDHLRWTFEVTHADTRGHEELIHPLLQAMWRLFMPLAIYNGINADHRRGVFTVIVRGIPVGDGMNDLSKAIRAALEFDPAVLPPLSTTKAAQVLQISADDLRLLVEVQEITPQREVMLTSRWLDGTVYQAFAVEDVLALKDELDERRRTARAQAD